MLNLMFEGLTNKLTGSNWYSQKYHLTNMSGSRLSAIIVEYVHDRHSYKFFDMLSVWQ